MISDEDLRGLINNVGKMIGAMPQTERFDKVKMFLAITLSASGLTPEESLRAVLLHLCESRGIPRAKLVYELPDGSEEVIEAVAPVRH